MKDFIHKLKENLADIFFPVRCPYCERVIDKTEYACENCKKQFPAPSVIKCCTGGFQCTSPFPYEGIFKDAVSNLKFKNCGSYSKQLSFVLVNSIVESFPQSNFDIITCVPMHKKHLKIRGYNQAKLLAEECSKIMNIPYADTLEKFKENKIQHTLKAKERAENVRGVYRVINKSSVKGKKILLIDDIVTTGNTLGECAKTLMKSGCKSVYCAVLCTSNRF